MEPSAFAALSLIGAPALLTNATSVLLMSTANRLGRSVDRARQLATAVAGQPGGSDMREDLMRQLSRAERRVLITVRAMSLLYFALGAFAVSTLAAFVGGALPVPATSWPFLAAVAVTMTAGIAGLVR